jgi:ABC-type Zn2+ transport system substrate-binding protein/surface adhesin
MKKVALVALFAGALSFASCGGASTNEEHDHDHSQHDHDHDHDHAHDHDHDHSTDSLTLDSAANQLPN